MRRDRWAGDGFHHVVWLSRFEYPGETVWAEIGTASCASPVAVLPGEPYRILGERIE